MAHLKVMTKLLSFLIKDKINLSEVFHSHLKTFLCIFIFALIFNCSQFFSQTDSTKKIVLKNAESLEFDSDDQVKAQRLIGNVIFEHEGATMYCDSAYLYKETNSLDAFSNVRILNETGETIYSDTLYYQGNEKLAKLRGNVILEEENQTLVTQYLDYDLNTDHAYYYGGGKLTNKTDSTELTSKIGNYFTKQKELFFKDDVVLIHPSYTIKSDTMMHNTETEITYYLGPTYISNEESNIYCEYGWFDKKTNNSKLQKNAKIELEEQTLSSDTILYNQNTSIGEAFSNVIIEDTSQNLLITGNYAYLNEKDSFTLVTNEALLIQYFDADTLYLHADTLINYQDSIKGRTTIGYHKVKFFKQDFQGKCDSLVMIEKDSLLYMYKEPVLWSDSSEMKSDTIIMKQNNGKIDKSFFKKNAFILSVLDSSKFNQISGNNMEGFFKNGELNKILVFQNALTIYYPEDKDGYIGVNKASGENLKITLKESQIKKIVFLTPNQAQLFPLSNPNNDEVLLPNFSNNNAFRPKSKEQIFNWP